MNVVSGRHATVSLLRRQVLVVKNLITKTQRVIFFKVTPNLSGCPPEKNQKSSYTHCF